jgi:hypothetical protein
VGKHEVKVPPGKGADGKTFAKFGVKGVDWNVLTQNIERRPPVKTIINPLFISVDKCTS